MRLARKLTLALIAVMVVLMTIKAYIRVQRDVRVFEDDMKRDHRSMARALMPAIAFAWREEGEERALALIEEANRGITNVTIRWVWLDSGANADHTVSVPLDHLSRLSEPAIDLISERDGDLALHTYVQVPIPGARTGALELSESLAEERTYVMTTIVRAIVATGATVILCGLVSWLLGIALIGRPVRRMIEKAHEVGRGHFGGAPLEIRGRNELSELAAELNVMTARLDAETKAHRTAEAELRHAERLSSVGKLASGIAHELGTPLNVASARAKMIVTGRASAEAIVENARIVGEQCDRMAAIIRQLLDFARRKPNGRSGSVDLVGLARETLALLDPLAWKRKVTLDTDVPADPVTVPGDRTLLQQVLTNLVMNAIQSMPAGGRVVVRLNSEDGEGRPRDVEPGPYACLSVRDTGSGMPRAVVEHVFEPFFTTKGVGEGTGLGLSVAYGIVKEHRGWIDVESNEGLGSCFKVHLPREAKT